MIHIHFRHFISYPCQAVDKYTINLYDRRCLRQVIMNKRWGKSTSLIPRKLLLVAVISSVSFNSVSLMSSTNVKFLNGCSSSQSDGRDNHLRWNCLLYSTMEDEESSIVIYVGDV